MYVNAIKQDISALSGGDGIDCWQIRYAHTDDGEPHDWVTKSNRTDRISHIMERHQHTFSLNELRTHSRTDGVLLASRAAWEELRRADRSLLRWYLQTHDHPI